MAVADILKDIGSGLATGAKAVGSVAEPILARTADVVSGEAPQIDAEQRKRQEALEDAAIDTKAKFLENQLAIGQKYGTLNPQQQQQYIDQITGLYSHPRHAAKLMEKLRSAIHPNGAFAQEPTGPLPNAVPAGGTAAEDARLAQEKVHPHPVPGVHPFKGPDGKYYQPMYDGYGNVINEEVQGYTPPEAKGGGKSPPVTGDQLPPDAVGVNGDPISPEMRNAGKSFVEYQGKWWAVAPQKPVMKTINGHLVLLDPKSGHILRDIGPVAGAKVTRRQTLQPGDDGQMHLVTLTSVTTPEGATIDVQPEDGTGGEQGGTPQGSQQGKPKSAGAARTPAKKVNPGSILPKTGAGRVHGSPVVPGLSTLAHSKNPLYKSEVQQYTKVAEDANAKKLAYQSAAGLLADNSRQTDLELVYAWVRANVQGAGRMTNTEIEQTGKAGSWGTRIQNAMSQASTGRLAPELEKQFLADIKRSYDNAQKEADDLKAALGGSPAPSNPPANHPSNPPSHDPLGVL